MIFVMDDRGTLLALAQAQRAEAGQRVAQLEETLVVHPASSLG